jgi:biotin carboxyl carrier protein
MTIMPKQRSSFGGRWTYGVIGLALLFVLMPFLFWNATWFGRPLNDAQLAKALTDPSHPREIQHALTQIEVRMEAGDRSARRWYPQLVALSSDPVDEIRVTDAWVMGQDNSAPDFHQALLKLLADPNPMVRRNAALSLVRFADASGREQIVAMLRPYEMPSPFAGKLKIRLKPGDVVNPGTMVGHIEVGDRATNEVRAVVPGTLLRWMVQDGTNVTQGQPIVSLAPSENMVWEALRALYLVGRPEDLPDVERFVRGAEGVPPEIALQAQSTSKAIRGRSTS